MIITHYGHSRFLITLSDGTRILTDPFDASTGYPVGKLSADVVTVSHHHHDHDAVDSLAHVGQVIDTQGMHTISKDIVIEGIESFHDDAQGQKRGKNLIFCIRAEGLNVVHLGDLGHVLDETICQKIGRCDLLLVPVGGFYTINADEARTVCEQLNPRVIIPMHYRTGYNADWPIEGPEAFLNAYKGQWESLSLLRVTAEDLACQPKVALLQDAEV